MIIAYSLITVTLLAFGLFRLADAILVLPSAKAGEAILAVKGTRSISKRIEAAAVEPLVSRSVPSANPADCAVSVMVPPAAPDRTQVASCPAFMVYISVCPLLILA